MVDEWRAEFGSDAPEAVSSLLHEVVDGQMAQSMNANQRAAYAWARANGDRERNHTTGVFLKRARRSGLAPILCVYVDSHAMATDFGVNKDIYLARLSNVGFEVSGIEFLPSRVRRKRDGAQREKKKESNVPAPLPELTETERAEVESLVADLPASIRDRATEAIIRMKRREN